MPRYHALQTAVTISTWDPHEASRSTISRPSSRQDLASDAYSLAPEELGNVLSKSSRFYTEGPAAGHLAQDLQEDYFEGHEGLDFLAGSMPFFLVRAGGDLFEAPAHLQGANHHTNESPSSGHSFQFSALQNASPRLNTPSVELDTDSLLSSIRSSRFDSPVPGLDESKDDHVEVNANNARSIKHTDLNHEPLETPSSKPLTVAQPIQVVVDVSHMSFMHSLLTNTRQELCINIFFNGELAQSRIVKHSCLRGPIHENKFQIYSGRRVDSNLEVPWVINPDDFEQSTDVGIIKSNSLEARWNHINQLLSVEADKWGKYEKCRSVTGEYLEELSKTALPHCMKYSTGGAGSRAGIIDVVITLGKSVAINAAGLRSPHRKLHEDYTGKERKLIVAPEEKQPKKKEQAIINSERESTTLEETLNGTAALGIPKTYTETSRPERGLLPPKNRPTMQSSAREVREAASQTEPMGGNSIEFLRGRSSPASSMPPPQKQSAKADSSPSLPLSFGRDGNGSFTAPFTPAREHPHKPKNVPQKTYKGLAPPEIIVKEAELPNSSYTLRSRTVPAPDIPSTSSQESITDQQNTTVSCRSSIRECESQPVSESSARTSRPILSDITDHPSVRNIEMPSHNSDGTRSSLGWPLSHISTSSESLSNVLEDNPSLNSRRYNTAGESSDLEINFGLDDAEDRSRRIRNSQGFANALTGKEDQPLVSTQDGGDIQQSPEQCSNGKIRVVFLPRNNVASAPVDRQKLLRIFAVSNSARENTPNTQTSQKAEPHAGYGAGALLPPSHCLSRAGRPSKPVPLAVPTQSTHKKASEYDTFQITNISTSKYPDPGNVSQAPPLDTSNRLRTEEEKTIVASNTSVFVAPHSVPLNASKSFRSESIASVAVSDTSSTANQPVKKKQKAAGRSMSARELGGLFDAHMPSVDIDESLLVSSSHTTRSSRVSTSVLAAKPKTQTLGQSLEKLSLKNIDALSDLAKPSTVKRTKWWPLPKPNAGSEILQTFEKPTHIFPPNRLRGKNEENAGLTISKRKWGNQMNSEQATGEPSMLAPKLTKTLIGSTQNKRPRSDNQNSQDSKLSEPRKDAIEISQQPKPVVRGRQGKTSLFSDAASNPKATSFLRLSPSGPALRPINIASPGESITVDPIPDQPPAPRQKNGSRSLSSPKMFPDASRSWQPNIICGDSVLRYAESADWTGVHIDKKTEMPVRTIKAERQGVFRATGVLMGVRFVIGV